MDEARGPLEEDPLLVLLPVVRRVVAARVRDPHTVDDLVQETLARVMAARARVERDTLLPYAIVTARNLVYSMSKDAERERRRAHLLVEPDADRPPDEVTGDIVARLEDR